jgi:hypothetical protein
MKMQEKMDKFEKELNLDLEKLELMVEQLENKYPFLEIDVYKDIRKKEAKEFADGFLEECEDFKSGFVDEEDEDNDNE